MKVLATVQLPGRWMDELRRAAAVDEWMGPGPAPRDWVMEHVGDKEGLLVSLVDRVDREVMDAAPMLRAISTYSVGYDHIDVEYASSRGIAVSHTPEVLTDATADLIFGLMMAVSRRIAEGDRLVRSGGWNGPWSPSFMLGRDVHGKVLGVLGMGRIGRALVRRAAGFGMRVIYHSREEKEDVDAEYVDLRSLLGRSDFLALAVDLNRSTYHMIGYGELRAMKPTAYLINASRGAVVDQAALVRALEEGLIAGAALDVYEEEPIPPDSPLLRFENVVLTPHVGSATVETRERMAEVAVENLLLSLGGREPLYRVPPRA